MALSTLPPVGYHQLYQTALCDTEEILVTDRLVEAAITPRTERGSVNFRRQY
jgi:hypothetical protein